MEQYVALDVSLKEISVCVIDGKGAVTFVASRRRPGWVSDRVAVPLRPGNAGGGKDPDFWCAFDQAEDR